MQTDWEKALAPIGGESIDVVVHLASQVHLPRNDPRSSLEQFREVNTAGTQKLAQQAARAGVRRFVFVSTIKVNGESGNYVETDKPIPQDAYAISKWEAELALHKVAAETGMEIVILRPPLVYGPGVRANFMRLMRLVDWNIPLPFSAASNQRSLIYLGNLTDAITTCISHPAAAGKTYLLSDGVDVSTSELVNLLARALGRSGRQFSISIRMLFGVSKMLGMEGEMSRLLGTLVADSTAIQKEIGWKPPFSLQEGLDATARWYRSTHR